MSKEDIINYVMTTPGNPNRAVLTGMLDGVDATPDWNENDPTSAAYIKNRPFYMKSGKTVYDGTLTFTYTGAPSILYASPSNTDFMMNEEVEVGDKIELSINGEVLFSGIISEDGSYLAVGIKNPGDSEGITNKIGILFRTGDTSNEYKFAANIMGTTDWAELNKAYAFQVVRYACVKIAAEFIPFKKVEWDEVLNKPDLYGKTSHSLVLNYPYNTVKGQYAIAEGFHTTASSNYSHAEGNYTTASGEYSHAEGSNTTASGSYSHAEGKNAKASGDYSHAEGQDTIANKSSSHAEGYNTTASGTMSHAEGYQTTASGDYSHAEGNYTYAYGNYSHAEGNKVYAYSHYSHVEGLRTKTGNSTSDKTVGQYAHAEGIDTAASGTDAHAENANTIASGHHSYAEGYHTQAKSNGSHSEGYYTQASNNYSHAEGNETTASGMNSHAEGCKTTADGQNSHAEGFLTTANHACQHVFGMCNVLDPSSAVRSERGTYVEIVGNGKSNDTSTTRSNARTLDWSGNESLAGSLTLGMGTEDEVTVTAAQLKALIALLNA